jgi:hypothetical protein
MSRTVTLTLSKEELDSLKKPSILAYTQRFPQEWYEVRVRTPGASRSDRQLRFYWFLVTGIAYYSGYTKLDIHRHLKFNFLDLDIELKELDCAEFATYLEQVVPYALENGQFEEDVYTKYEGTKV